MTDSNPYSAPPDLAEQTPEIAPANYEAVSLVAVSIQILWYTFIGLTIFLLYVFSIVAFY